MRSELEQKRESVLPPRQTAGVGVGLVTGLWLAAALVGGPARAIVPEPLALRISDAIGAPGGQTAIVFRTYASRPIRRGQIHTGFAPGRALAAGASRVSRVPVDPIQSYDGGLIFSVSGDAVPVFTFDSGAQSIDAQFESLSASINALDGVLGVLFVTLSPDVVPGDDYTIDFAPDMTSLDDASENPVGIELRGGRLSIRAADAALALAIEGGKVQPGSGARIEVGTQEPFDVATGRIVFTYDPAVATGLPSVIAHPRHGSIALTVSYPQTGKVQIDLASAAEDWNSVPGDLLEVQLATRPDVPLGTFSPLQIVAAESFLNAPGGAAIDMVWESESIEFVADPGVFRDGFDTGDRGYWSYLP
ncbi:MAG: hypothetical protein ABI639_01945 [Thermoanaerobaculia bacterium]